jgi:hypothetical protein
MRHGARSDVRGSGSEYERLWVQLWNEVHTNVMWEDGENGPAVTWALLSFAFPQETEGEEGTDEEFGGFD